MVLTKKVAVLPSGVTLPYVEQGDPAGPALLLLHGYTDSWRSFVSLLPLLPRGLRVVAPSQRGHGDADQPAGGYDPSGFAADLAAFMDTIGLGPAVIVGHSMGSLVALRFALDQPGRVRGLVLIGAFATPRGNPAVQELWDTAVSNLSDPVDPAFVRAFQESTLARPVPNAFLESVVQDSMKVPARVWRAALSGLMETDLQPELGRIATPTLILWGDRDAFVDRAAQESLAAAIPGARLRVYPGAGHSPQWEDPAEVAADLGAFLAALAAGEQPGA